MLLVASLTAGDDDLRVSRVVLVMVVALETVMICDDGDRGGFDGGDGSDDIHDGHDYLGLLWAALGRVIKDGSFHDGKRWRWPPPGQPSEGRVSWETNIKILAIFSKS